MAVKRDNPYSAFNFLVSLGGDQGSGGEGEVIGGFSDVSGLDMEVSFSEYRNGNEKGNYARKIPNISKFGDVTLKRGLVGSVDLKRWINGIGEGEHDPRQVTVTLLDEARNEVATWVLTNAQPKKWSGPTLAAKGGSDVAMEELVLAVEHVDYQ